MENPKQSTNTPLAMYGYYPGLESIPHLYLGNYPTPVQKLEETGRSLGDMNIWIKRDDLCHPRYGGNKPRKYEFVMAQAQSEKKTHLVTTGGIGSNHVLANTIFGQPLGFESYIYIFDQPLTEHCRTNMLCDLHYGAKMFYTKTYVKTAMKMIWKILVDRKAFLIMPGASNPTGTLGFVNAGFELADQIKKGEMPEPDKLFVAVGSAGTCAGLTVGFELAGLKTKVIGISVSMESFTTHKKVLKLAKATLALMRKVDPSIPDVSEKLGDRLTIDHSFYGGEYGRATHEGLEAIEIVKQDGIHLDVVYTGKTFSGLVAYCQEQNEQAKGETILFWNTLNSVDLQPIVDQVDYHSLPNDLHKFFDGTVPLDEAPVYARNTK